MRPITRSQLITLTFINNFTVEHGYPPSIKEMAQDRNIANNASQEQVDALCKKGYITKQKFVARSTVLTEKGSVLIAQFQ